MLEFEVDGLKIAATPQNIKIIDSYKIQDKKQMKQIIKKILQIVPLYITRRTLGSLVREWRCHNRFYNLGLFKSHTKDCDLEAKERLYRRFVYFFLGRF